MVQKQNKLNEDIGQNSKHDIAISDIACSAIKFTMDKRKISGQQYREKRGTLIQGLFFAILDSPGYIGILGALSTILMNAFAQALWPAFVLMGINTTKGSLDLDLYKEIIDLIPQKGVILFVVFFICALCLTLSFSIQATEKKFRILKKINSDSETSEITEDQNKSLRYMNIAVSSLILLVFWISALGVSWLYAMFNVLIISMGYFKIWSLCINKKERASSVRWIVGYVLIVGLYLALELTGIADARNNILNIPTEDIESIRLVTATIITLWFAVIGSQLLAALYMNFKRREGKKVDKTTQRELTKKSFSRWLRGDIYIAGMGFAMVLLAVGLVTFFVANIYVEVFSAESVAVNIA